MSDILCPKYPSVFASPYLDEFNHENYLEDHPVEQVRKENGELPNSEEEAKDIQHQQMLVAEQHHYVRNVEITIMAKDICERCPLKLKCSQQNITADKKPSDMYGVVAGLTLKERNSAQKRLKKERTEALQAQAAVRSVITAVSAQDKRRLTDRLLSS